MPRNRSEKLPRCREAIAYADAAEAWLLDGTPRESIFSYWDSIPGRIREQISDNTTGSGNIRAGRVNRVAYIREHYAP